MDEHPDREGQGRQAGSRVAVVTGASAGVGREVSRQLADSGWDVALLARGEAGLAAAAEEVEATGRTALPLSVDVADARAVAEAAESIEDRLGTIELWVNSAMTSVLGPFMQTPPQEYARVTEVCYLGYVHGTHAALAHMAPRDRGVVVQVGSALAYRGIPLQSAYCGAKHAVRGFSDSLRAELLHEGSRIRITEVHLPAVNTPQFSWVRSRLRGRPRPVPPVFDPAVAARAVVFAAHNPRRRTYWVGGSTVATVLAARLAPRLVDHYLARTAYAAQQRQERATQEDDNLYTPLDTGSPEADFGARGPVAEESRRWSAQMWLSRHRRAATAMVLGAVAGTAAVLRRRRRGSRPRAAAPARVRAGRGGRAAP